MNDEEPPTKPGRRRPLLMIETESMPPAIETESMPPTERAPEPWRVQRRESLIPPRAAPAAGSSAFIISAAATAAYTIPNPTIRALLMLLCGVVVWGIGYFTPPPRRHFRREDTRDRR
jgi:hypothetical protein